MLDPAIEVFFTERKEAWLKKNLKANMTEDEVRNKTLECEEVFALKNWLPNAAVRVNSRALTTHPSKFSHPSTGVGKKNLANSTYVTPIIYEGEAEKDGFLRSGSVVLSLQLDSVGNAAELDVEDFLRLEMSDGQQLIEHFERQTELAAETLSEFGEGASEVTKQLLAIKRGALSSEAVTSSKIKQVYFPVEDGLNGYHLLSVLSHSGHLFEMRKRLDKLRFSEETKAHRELRKNNQYSGAGYREIYNLTTIGYGGTKPQNISVLNNQYAGKAHLLLSVPPELLSRNTRLPSRNFFIDVLYAKSLQDIFQAFHRLAIADYNNAKIRRGLDYRIEAYLDQLILKMWQVRQSFIEQPYSRPEALPAYQKLWLFPEHEVQRGDSDVWLDEVIRGAARHFNACYQKVLGKAALQLGDDLQKKVIEIIEQNREAML